MLIASACSEQIHRNFISPPSLWPGRELREYHCARPDHRGIREPPVYQCTWFCSPRRRIAASRFGDVEDKLFNFQGTVCTGCLTQVNTDSFFALYTRRQKISKKCRLQISRNRHSPQILNFVMLSAICMRMYCFRSSSKRPYEKSDFLSPFSRAQSSRYVF